MQKFFCNARFFGGGRTAELRKGYLQYDPESGVFTLFFCRPSMHGDVGVIAQQPQFSKANIEPLKKEKVPNGINYIIKLQYLKVEEIQLQKMDKNEMNQLHLLLIQLVGLVKPGKSIASSVETKRRNESLTLSTAEIQEPEKRRKTDLHNGADALHQISFADEKVQALRVSDRISTPKRSTIRICNGVKYNGSFHSSLSRKNTLTDVTPSHNFAVLRPLSSSMGKSTINIRKIYGNVPLSDRSDHKNHQSLIRMPLTERQTTDTPSDSQLTKTPSINQSFLVTSVKENQTIENCLGLPNIGNSCYINAVLQVFFNLQFFDRLYKFFKERFNTRKLDSIQFKKVSSITYALVNVFRSKLEDKRQYLWMFRDRITELNKFSGLFQEDAHEFFVFLLERIESEMVAIEKACEAVSIENNCVLQLTPKRVTASQQQCLSLELGLVVQSFFYSMSSVYRCSICQAENTRNDNGNHFILQIPIESTRKKSLTDIMLESFENAEQVPMKCEKCDGFLRKAHQYFTKLPKYMVFMLQRYSFDTSTGNRSKITSSVYVCDRINFSMIQPTSIPKCKKLSVISANVLLSPPASNKNFSPSVGFRSLSLKSRMPLFPENLEPVKMLSAFADNDFHSISPMFSDDDADDTEHTSQEISVLNENVQNLKKKLLYTPVDYAWRKRTCDELEILHYFVVDCASNIYEQYRICDQTKIEYQQNEKAANVASVSADGNCLFRALSHYLTGGTEKAHVEIREKVCKFMALYSQIFSRHCGKTDEEFVEYVNEMQKTGTWGTDVELLAFATMVQTPVSTYLNNRWICYPPRFTVNSENGGIIKISTPAQHNMLSENANGMIYLVNSYEHYEPVLSIPEMLSYQLRGIVNHIGCSTETGHYTALLKLRKSWNSKRWVQCDDSNVNEISEESSLDNASRTGYMFFYESTTNF